ncbi:hypothetical protein GCM10011390_43900 [Aureimonas endophytica]|uniref:Flagellar assembly protein FliH n=1 Tax=Aureimonas endophytica TaxID=2027858 RepID=A0A916ZZA0_9HYPH|nr:hypothetical protein [Aureimonas endophytica]GGE19866.1 hypothetical protein GCM10011390_43900 [Aureimonas endophytica]
MIPLSQYLSDGAGEDFTPLMALAARKAALAGASSGGKTRPLKVLPKAPEAAAPAATSPAPVARPVAARPAAPAPAAPRLVTEPRVPLRELEAEKAARAAEREAHAAELAEATETARQRGIELGRAMAREEAEADLVARLAALRAELAAANEAELRSERAMWTAEQGDRLADLVILQMAILEETVKLTVGNVLRPLALDLRRRQMVDEMVGAVKTIALDGSAYRIAASGPADLLTALETKLGDDARLLSFTPDEEKADIRIDADATVIESRLSSWRSALEEALS